MLTVYSTQSSPGASTTAMHLAANWASGGREVLLIELDPAGGSLSHNLGIQFTPGSASFVASGDPVLSNHLIDHAQDVLFENFHVMPAPASPTGARGIFNTFAEFAEDLRTISEHEMAVIIDAGRITADTAASELTTGATGVVVVCRNNSQLSSLEHLRDVLAAGSGEGPVGCAVTVGKSPMDPDEWLETTGLNFCGSVEMVSDMATDLSAYMARSKRRSKKFRASLEQVGEKLYPLAQPPLSASAPRRRSAESAEPAAAKSADVEDADPAPAPSQDPAGYGQPPAAPPEPPPGFAPPMAPAGYGQSHYLPPAAGPPSSAPSHFLPPTGWPGDPRAPQGYGEPPPTAPPEGLPAYGQPAPPSYPPAQYPPPDTYEQPPDPYQQPGPYQQPPDLYPPSRTYEQPPGTYQQPQPTPPEAYQQPQPTPPGTYEQPQPTPPGTYEQPPHEAYQQPQYPPPEEYQQAQYPPAEAYEQPPPPINLHEQPVDRPEPPAQQAPPEQPAAHPEHAELQAAHGQGPETESVPRPSMQPTGSFRDWAVKLHGSNAHDMTARRGG